MVPSLDILSGAISKKSRITFARHGLPLYHFTQRLQAFYALMPYYPVLFLDEKVASSHLVLNPFNSLAKKKQAETYVSEETKSSDSRDILRVWFCFKISQSDSCKIQDKLHHPFKNHFLRLLFKPFSLFF